MMKICGAVLAKRSLSKGSVEDQLRDLPIEVIGECVCRIVFKAKVLFEPGDQLVTGQ